MQQLSRGVEVHEQTPWSMEDYAMAVTPE
jgi:hypothetical protein